MKRVAAPPRLGRGHSVETSRGATAAGTRIFRGNESRRRRGCDVDIPWRPSHHRYSGPGGGCRIAGLAPTTRYRLRCCVVASVKGQLSKFAAAAHVTTGPAPATPRIKAWYKTPPDQHRVRRPAGPGWCERTCELALAPKLPSSDAAFLVLFKEAAGDDVDDDAEWRRCYRGRLDRVKATSLVAGKAYRRPRRSLSDDPKSLGRPQVSRTTPRRGISTS